MVRAKFQVTEHRQRAYGNPPTVAAQVEVILTPQYDMSIEEDKRYAKYTPSGNISMSVDNPAALAQLKLGQFFYVDFTPVEQPIFAGPEKTTTIKKDVANG